MYNLKDFEAYTPHKYLGSAVCLVWSKQTGYMFMSALDRFKAMTDNLDFKIVGVEK